MAPAVTWPVTPPVADRTVCFWLRSRAVPPLLTDKVPAIVAAPFTVARVAEVLDSVARKLLPLTMLSPPLMVRPPSGARVPPLATVTAEVEPGPPTVPREFRG